MLLIVDEDAYGRAGKQIAELLQDRLPATKIFHPVVYQGDSLVFIRVFHAALFSTRSDHVALAALSQV